MKKAILVTLVGGLCAGAAAYFTETKQRPVTAVYSWEIEQDKYGNANVYRVPVAKSDPRLIRSSQEWESGSYVTHAEVNQLMREELIKQQQAWADHGAYDAMIEKRLRALEAK